MSGSAKGATAGTEFTTRAVGGQRLGGQVKLFCRRPLPGAGRAGKQVVALGCLRQHWRVPGAHHSCDGRFPPAMV